MNLLNCMYRILGRVHTRKGEGQVEPDPVQGAELQLQRRNLYRVSFHHQLQQKTITAC